MLRLPDFPYDLTPGTSWTWWIYRTFEVWLLLDHRTSRSCWENFRTCRGPLAWGPSGPGPPALRDKPNLSDLFSEMVLELRPLSSGAGDILAWPVFLGKRVPGPGWPWPESGDMPDQPGSIDNFATRPEQFFPQYEGALLIQISGLVYLTDGLDEHDGVRGPESAHKWDMRNIHTSISLGRRQDLALVL